MTRKVKNTKTAREIILASLKRGATNAATLERVRKVHPRTTLGLATVNWYRSRLRSAGKKIPSDRAARRKA